MNKNSSVDAPVMSAKRQPSLVDQVAEGLDLQIRRGDYEVGTMLPSVQTLSESWGVSRTVMREALSRLSTEGLITSRQGVGVFVAANLPPQRLVFANDPSDAGLISILEIRLGLEAEAAGLAALRRTSQDIADMESALHKMETCFGDGDIEKSIEADLAFHRAIWLASRNPHFGQLFAFLSQFLQNNISASRRSSASVEGRAMEAQSEHSAIFSAIKLGDSAAARVAARQHVVNTTRRLDFKLALEAATDFSA
ncbi:FadR/GntR family transcriptional regulator [Sulfitobacter sp. 1A16787]|uniref:FadR/GntR family transcriptional regulator n=1 Tax=Sulfitobacter sp. 1A16787 TaxID=3368571 RepID=UPI003744EB8A